MPVAESRFLRITWIRSKSENGLESRSRTGPSHCGQRSKLLSRVLPLISTIDLWRTYQLGSEEINALRGVNMTVMPGQFIAVVGRSGSGKTTLLNILAGLDKPTSGQVLFENRDIAAMNEHDLTEIRRHKIGFVFQSFGLLPLLSAFENVELPLRIAGVRTREREERTRDALEIVGLWGRAKHRPYELSGGEQQRVAIARAVVNNPPLILADEPTGELDSTNARAIFGLFKEMVLKQGISVLSATHDSTLLAMADEVKEIRDGHLNDATDLGQRYRD
ncbi:MAG TPA: ABC transporter ATP-binding protein [Dehalococcoidia bacterium]|nr:ABC transporter ATP-binding protein [Dehalococcoidia bacterium]